MRTALPVLGALLFLSITATTLPAQGLVLKTISPFAANNRGSSGGCVMFDLKVTGSVLITSLVSNYGANAGIAVGVKVMIAANTYIGNENTASAWTQVGQDDGTATSAGRNQQTMLPLQAPIILTPGTHGIMLIAVNSAHAYTNGNGTNQSHTGTLLSLTAGAASNVPYVGIFSPRVWNGEIHYQPSGAAISAPFGTGCAGSNGTPSLIASAGSTPKLGTTFSMDFGNLTLPGASVFVLVGFSNQQLSSGISLPIDLAVIGAPGCNILVDPLATSGTGGVNGMATYMIPIPADPNLKGVAVYIQGLTIDPAANAIGLTTTNGLTAYLGV